MADEDELIAMRHPESGQATTASRRAFDGAWSKRGWVLDVNADVEHPETETDNDGPAPAVVNDDGSVSAVVNLDVAPGGGDITAETDHPKRHRGVGRNG